jgi:hypothetical protein
MYRYASHLADRTALTFGGSWGDAPNVIEKEQMARSVSFELLAKNRRTTKQSVGRKCTDARVSLTHSGALLAIPRTVVSRVTTARR